MIEQYVGAFGGVDLWITSTQSRSGRDVAVQSPSRGDRHVIQDRGLAIRRTTCELLFATMPQELEGDSYIERFQAFQRMANTGEAATFTHPLDGSYTARIESFEYNANADEDAIRATAVFIAEDEPIFVRRPGGGATTDAGEEAVAVAAAVADAAVVAAGVVTTAPAKTNATVAGWAAQTKLDAASVLLEVATVSREIDAAIALTNYATSYEQWAAFKALVLLRYQLARAAETFTAESSRVFDLYVTSPEPLLAICARVYGAANAEERAAEVARGNRIRTPGLIPGGTTLKMPSQGAA